MKKIQINRNKNDNQEQRFAYFRSLQLDDCLKRMKVMGVYYPYHVYEDLLMKIADIDEIANDIIEEFHLRDRKLNYELGGLHIDLVNVTLEKIASTMKVKASDFYAIGIKCKHSIKEKTINIEHYLHCFTLCEQVLMIMQYYHMNDILELERLLGCGMHEFFMHFILVAKQVLPKMSFDDVLYYENFISEIINHFYVDDHDLIYDLRKTLALLYYNYGYKKEAMYEYKLIELDYNK